jgi:hypothetical protein
MLYTIFLSHNYTTIDVDIAIQRTLLLFLTMIDIKVG